MLLKFTEDAWADYCYWQTQDKKTLKRINMLIKDIQRDPFSGIGKPESLKYISPLHIANAASSADIKANDATSPS